MANVNLGKVALTPKGNWDNTITYEKLDIVQYDGNSYIAKTGVPIGISVTTGTEYWQLFSAKGNGISVGDVIIASTTQPTVFENKLWIREGSDEEYEVLTTEDIDDTAGEGDNDVVWSADKSYKEITNVQNIIGYDEYSAVGLSFKLENDILIINGRSTSSFYLKISNGFEYSDTPIGDDSPWLLERLNLVPGHSYVLGFTKINGSVYYDGSASGNRQCGIYLYTKNKTYTRFDIVNKTSESFDGLNQTLYSPIADTTGEDLSAIVIGGASSFVFTNYRIKIDVIDITDSHYLFRDFSKSEVDALKVFKDNIDKLEFTTNAICNSLNSVNIDFEKYDGFYQFYNNTFYPRTTTYKSSKVYIDPNIKTYYITSKMSCDSPERYSFVSYFDNNDNLISNEYIYNEFSSVSSIIVSAENKILHIPENTSWFFVNGHTNYPTIKGLVKNQKNYIDKKCLSVLFIGNSLTQDAIAYLPYMLWHYYPEVDFNIYMWYCGGFTLAQHYEYFVNDTKPNIFSVAENKPFWNNDKLEMSNILSTYKFDIVCMQEYFNNRVNYDISDLADWNNCQNYIANHYTGGNALKFITYFHAPKRSIADDVYNLTKTGISLILKNTIAEDMIPAGMAVYDALSTDLDDLGDNRHLSPDGIHTQEGLPCLLQTYNTLCWLFDKLAIQKSIYNFGFRMTTGIYNTINVPGPNLGSGVITGTDAQNILAQEVAIKAYKKGKSFVNNNLC